MLDLFMLSFDVIYNIFCLETMKKEQERFFLIIKYWMAYDGDKPH